MKNKKIIEMLIIFILISVLFVEDSVMVFASEQYDLVNQVKKYTSEFDGTKIQNLIDKKKYREAKQLIEEAKDGYNERWSLKGLRTNDIYIAYQFKEYMTGDFFSKGNLAKISTNISSFIFKHELKDYISGKSPGVEKYKEMLKQFIGNTSEEVICLEYADKLASAFASVDGINDFFDNDTYDILYNMFSDAGSKEDIDKAVLEFVDANSEIFKNESNIYLFKNDLSDSFTIFGAGLEYIDTTVDAIKDIQYMCSQKDSLKYYDDLLTNIQHAKDEKGSYFAPTDLRKAAGEIQRELKGEISEYIRVIETTVKGYGYTTVTTAAAMANLVENGVFSEISLGMKVGVIIGNAIFDMSGLVDGVAYVQGYAYLGEIYSSILEQDRQKFISNSSSENAEQFKKDYDILCNIRLYGEKSYLDMSDFSGSWDSRDQEMLQSWTDYESKSSFCNNNIEMIKGFKFILPDVVKHKDTMSEIINNGKYLTCYKDLIQNNDLIKLSENSLDTDLYLTLIDIDFDNIPELFFYGGEYNSATSETVDVYGIENGKAVMLFNGAISLDDIKLCKDMSTNDQFYYFVNGRMGWVHDYRIGREGLIPMYHYNVEEDKYYIGHVGETELNTEEITQEEYNNYFNKLDMVSTNLIKQYFSTEPDKNEIIKQLEKADEVFRQGAQ